MRVVNVTSGASVGGGGVVSFGGGRIWGRGKGEGGKEGKVERGGGLPIG